MLETSIHLFPGIEKSTALYFDPLLNGVFCKGIINRNIQTIQDFTLTDHALVANLRKRKFQFQWMRADQLPFETIQLGQKQLNIFDETENIVLALAFENSHDQQADLLFLYLSKNMSSFGISNSTNTLSTSEKAIIGAMAYNIFKIQWKNNHRDSETLIAINQQIKKLHDENDQLKNEIELLKDNFQQRFIEICQEHLQKLSSQYQISFELDKSAIHKINGFVGTMEQLKTSLAQAVQLAINMNYGNNYTTIVLKEWNIKFDDSTHIVNKSLLPTIQQRYQKTYLLLEKLENAARVVTNNNERLTSENVGSACPIPISAPAISDALKNHHKKVISLLTEFPEMWPTIRNEFRPIKNLLNNQQAV